MHARRLCHFLCRVINYKCKLIATPIHANRIHALMFRLARAATKNSARRVICRELLQSATRYVFQLMSCNLDQWMLVCVGANYRNLHKNVVRTMGIRNACHLNIVVIVDFWWQIGTGASLRFLFCEHIQSCIYIYMKHLYISSSTYSYSNSTSAEFCKRSASGSLCAIVDSLHVEHL
jgi:hypothetical protein